MKVPKGQKRVYCVQMNCTHRAKLYEPMCWRTRVYKVELPVSRGEKLELEEQARIELEEHHSSSGHTGGSTHTWTEDG